MTTVSREKVRAPLGRVQENFSWRDCLGTFLALALLAAIGWWLSGAPALPLWAPVAVAVLLAALSAVLTLGRRFFELVLRMLIGRGALD